MTSTSSTAASPQTTSAVLTATLVEDVLVLATQDDEVAVQVPLHDAGPLTRSGTAVLDAVAVVCALDSALTRRLYRRVSAWRLDTRGQLSARVRPSA